MHVCCILAVHEGGKGQQLFELLDVSGVVWPCMPTLRGAHASTAWLDSDQVTIKCNNVTGPKAHEQQRP